MSTTSVLDPAADTFVSRTMCAKEEKKATQEPSPCMSSTTTTAMDKPVEANPTAQVNSALAIRVALRPRPTAITLPEPKYRSFREMFCAGPEEDTAATTASNTTTDTTNAATTSTPAVAAPATTATPAAITASAAPTTTTITTAAQNKVAATTTTTATPAVITATPVTTTVLAVAAPPATTTTVTTVVQSRVIASVNVPIRSASYTPRVVTSATAQKARTEFGRLPRVLEEFEKPDINVDKDEFSQDVAKYGLKTLQDSRWATKKTEAPGFRRDVAKYGSKTLKDSRWTTQKTEAPGSRRSAPVRREGSFGREGSFRGEGSFRREAPKYGLKTTQDSRRRTTEKTEVPRAIVEQNEFKDRVVVNKEEFDREVAEYGLKTLKDSRWAN
ncbi:hypothetical protein HD806DRAFT_540539 [Xylariaceae sp. AK1471]|nr:hypothetical protein HD806DRAFT_540539 [Xylariaceae sp. AK1471]